MNFSSLFKKQYYPLNTIEISQDALLNNYQYLSNGAGGMAVAPVLKSNAYGHGLRIVAKVLDESGAPFFCVDSLYEAYELLKNKIKTPVLIMGYVNPENLKIKQLPFSYAVYDDELIAGISRYQPQAGVHIFVDTGMHREGISLADLPGFLTYIKSEHEGLRVEGLMSHLAQGEDPDNPRTQKQIANFKKAEEIVRSAGFSPKWLHIGASGALMHKKAYTGQLGTLFRAGISLYGIDPQGKDKQLQPALKLKTTLNQVKQVKKGEKIGYDFTFTAKKDMAVGILPIGYFDGVERRLSNRGVVLLKKPCLIIGRVSMNVTTIDVSGVESPKRGDEVIVYSDNPMDENSICNAAKVCGTIPYDLLVHIGSTMRRKMM